MKLQLTVSLLLVLLFMKQGATHDCWGNYNGTTLYCHGLVLEADKSLEVDREVFILGNSVCNEMDCLNYAFPEIAISGSSGSIGAKTFSLMPEMESLLIRDSHISHIEDGAICSLPNLRGVTLEEDLVLPTITASMFNNCNKLKRFQCDSCQNLEHEVLKHMVNLESLVISVKNISHFTKDYLKPLIMLKELELLHYSIDNIEEGALCLSPSLNILRLISGEIVPKLTKSVFLNCSNVLHFEIKFSKILNIEEHAFSDFLNIKTASFSRLNINHLKKELIGGLKNAERLEIFNSRIPTISGDCFEDFDKLTELILSGLSLKEIDPEMLTHLPKLVKLDLRYNELTSIEGLTHPRLEYLWLHDNRVSDINAETLKATLPNLKKLYISGNPVYEKKATLAKQLEPYIKIE